MSRRSLRSELLTWLLVPLGLLWLADAFDAFARAQRAVDLAHDRPLYAAVLAIAERVSLADGRPVVDVPPVALEVLDTDSQERLFYSVSYRTGDGPRVHLTGYADLPEPPADDESASAELGDPLAIGAHAPSDVIPPPVVPVYGPTYRDTTFRGDPVRIAWMRRVLPTAPPIEVDVQVAETVRGLVRLRAVLMAREMGFELFAIVLAIGAVTLGVWRGLRPILQLSRDVAARSETDLSPLPFGRVPREIAPVVASVNELLERLREAMGSQARFIADASHALRTPLAVLRSEADLMLRLERPEELRRAAANLRAHVEATSRLASQLLALARAGRRSADAPMEWFDVAAAVRDACGALVPAAIERGVDLGYAGEGSVLALGREAEIREAIGNLVDNALRYGRPQGMVTVSVTRAGGEAVLSVEDDGPGIPAAHRETALQPFHRLPGTPGEGSGLGLAIVREIAAQHGAPLRLTDGKGGRGLRVELTLRSLPGGADVATGS